MHSLKQSFRKYKRQLQAHQRHVKNWTWDYSASSKKWSSDTSADNKLQYQIQLFRICMQWGVCRFFVANDLKKMIGLTIWERKFQSAKWLGSGMTNYPIGPHRTQSVPIGPHRDPIGTQSDPVGPIRTQHRTSSRQPQDSHSFSHSRAPCKHVW